MDPGDKRQFGLGILASDRSYIQNSILIPINTEIRTVKTYTSGGGGGLAALGGGGGATVTGCTMLQVPVTVEMNTSMLLLPQNTYDRRLFDSRVGFFADGYVVYSDEQQKVETRFAVRWRLEPKPEDMEKYKRGELVEPAKQIVYYIDPATPKQWR